MILDAIRESGGTAVAVPETRIVEAMSRAMAAEGIAVCPEAAACVLAAEALKAEEWLRPDEQVVLFNTGAAQKYPEARRIELPRVDLSQPIDYAAL